MATICTRRGTNEAHGVARWLERPKATADGPTRMGVLAVNGHAYDLAEQLDEAGAPAGWWLARRGEPGARYYVDTTFGPDAASWSCTCPAARWRHGCCKHVGALWAALRHLEAPAAPKAEVA